MITKRKIFIGLTLAIVILGLFPFYVQSAWYNGAWAYRQHFTITGSPDSTLTNYPVKFIVRWGNGTSSGNVIYTNSHAQVNFNDLRFTKSNGTTLLPYWRESYTVSNSTIVWVNFDSIAQSPSTTAFYVYYGNGVVATASDGEATFSFFDDFSGALGDWTHSGAFIVGGVCQIAGAGAYIESIASFGAGYSSRVYSRAITTTGSTITGWDILNECLPENWNIDGGDGTHEGILSAYGCYSVCTNAATTIVKNTFYHIREIEVPTLTNIKYFYDDTQYVNTCSTASACTGTPCISAGDGHIKMVVHTDTIFVDWALVRKITSNEPSTFTWATEQALGNPAITTVAASNIATTSARLNGLVTNDGHDDCRVQFAYARTALGPFANYAAIVAAGFAVNASGTYNTGGTPFVNISGLLADTSYTFQTRIINVLSTQYGAQMTFSTLIAVLSPTNFKGIPTATTISLFWTKGSGSTNTLIKYKKGSYPISTTDGSTAYNNTLAAVTITGLERGTNYYFRAWGESGGVYSATNSTLLLTTLAYVPSSVNNATINTPSFWFQAPNYTRMSAFFMYDWFNWIADVITMPRSTFWFLGTILLEVVTGIILYALHPNLVITMVAVAIVGVVCVLMGLQPMWLLFPYFVIGIASIMVGERR